MTSTEWPCGFSSQTRRRVGCLETEVKLCFEESLFVAARLLMGELPYANRDGENAQEPGNNNRNAQLVFHALLSSVVQ